MKAIARSIPGRCSSNETNLAPRARLTVTPGQQTGSKRLKAASLNHAESNDENPKNRINRAIPRSSSPIVVTLELACHAGGRGFESRRSRKSPAKEHSALLG
jgi:hypothetical protein